MTCRRPARKVRVSPVAGQGMVWRPPWLSSTIAPASDGVGPEMVPVPSRSPLCRLQPPTVCCVTICATVQYWWRKLVREISGGRQALRAVLRSVSRPTVSCMSRPPWARLSALSR
jgi:hypothetical protein